MRIFIIASQSAERMYCCYFKKFKAIGLSRIIDITSQTSIEVKHSLFMAGTQPQSLPYSLSKEAYYGEVDFVFLLFFDYCFNSLTVLEGLYISIIVVKKE